MTTSGYTNCRCRDCFETTVSDDMAAPEFCSDCEAAGCEDDSECQVVPDDGEGNPADPPDDDNVTCGDAPSSWASYFMNGDSSALDTEEIEQADKFAEWLGGTIVDCSAESFFTWRHDASQFGVKGADCVTYKAIKV